MEITDRCLLLLSGGIPGQEKYFPFDVETRAAVFSLMPRRMAFAMIISFFAVALYSVRAQQDEKRAKNTDLVIAESHVLPGLPDAFALAYEFEPDSTSPDGRFGVIFPGTHSDFPNEETLGRDFVVSLKPFQVLAANEGVYYRGTNGMGVEWTRDSSAVLVTLGGRWGTIGATLFELRDGRVTRRTDLWAVMMKLVAAKFPKGKVKPYNGVQLFSPDSTDNWNFSEDGKQVSVELDGSTAPNAAPGLQWAVTFKGVWSVPQAKWIEHKITGKTYRNRE